MKSITIDVTKAHIKKGVSGDDDSCAIALALESYFGKDASVSVNENDITVTIENNDYDFTFQWNKTPKAVGSFIDKFDDEKPVKPFSFKLPFPKIK